MLNCKFYVAAFHYMAIFSFFSAQTFILLQAIFNQLSFLTVLCVRLSAVTHSREKKLFFL